MECGYLSVCLSGYLFIYGGLGLGLGSFFGAHAALQADRAEDWFEDMRRRGIPADVVTLSLLSHSNVRGHASRTKRTITWAIHHTLFSTHGIF